MRHRVTGLRLILAAVLALTASASMGCAYAQQRWDDLVDTVDLGLTVSSKPQFAIYADGVSVLPGGFGYVDGYFVGIGGGQVGITRHYEQSWGLVVIGWEEVGWGEFDKRDPSTLNRQFVGVAGVPLFPFKYSRPAYMPACVHYFHLGWLGVSLNLRYLEVVDSLLGWFGIDICDDDGKKLGTWAWRTEESMKEEASDLGGRIVPVEGP